MSQNPFESPQYDYPSVADRANADIRTTFIRKTYLHLLGAILAFIALDAIILTLFSDQLDVLVPKITGGYMWLVVLGAFMLVSYIADRWAHSDTSRQTQYIGLGLYVVAEALIFIPLLYIAQKYAPDVIPSAGLVTAVMFGGLTITVFATKADFSFLKWGLVAGGFVAIALIIGGIVMGFDLGIWFAGAMCILASAAILYSTSNVLHHYRTDQHVAASLALFSSVALLLWYVIQMFMYMDD